jgi:hypothetical protein
VRRTTRCITTLTAVGLVASMSVPAFAKTESGRTGSGKISTTDACTIVTKKQLARFGKPVGTPTPTATKLDCKFPIGEDPAVAPGGTFTAFVLYPNPFAAHVDSAQAGVEDQFAINKLSNEDVEDVSGLGASAFFNWTESYVVFAPNKKLGVILRWEPAPTGTTMTKRDRNKLIALAKDVTKRANG